MAMARKSLSLAKKVLDEVACVVEVLVLLSLHFSIGFARMFVAALLLFKTGGMWRTGVCGGLDIRGGLRWSGLATGP
jgi:hypothetical protein